MDLQPLMTQPADWTVPSAPHSRHYSSGRRQEGADYRLTHFRCACVCVHSFNQLDPGDSHCLPRSFCRPTASHLPAKRQKDFLSALLLHFSNFCSYICSLICRLFCCFFVAFFIQQSQLPLLSHLSRSQKTGGFLFLPQFYITLIQLCISHTPIHQEEDRPRLTPSRKRLVISCKSSQVLRDLSAVFRKVQINEPKAKNAKKTLINRQVFLICIYTSVKEIRQD